MQTSVAKKIFAVGVAASTVLMSLAPFAAQAAAHAQGTNVKSSDGTVSMIIDGQRRPYTSAGAFLSYGFNSWSSVVDANADDLALPVGSFIPPQDGKIFCADMTKDSDVKGECSLITGGQKAAFTSAPVFTGLGFSFSRSVTGDSSFMTKTSNIDNTTAAHKPGVLVNNAGTVYLVGATGLLGIPDVATFNSWGYSFSDVVPANTADKAMSQTGVMAARSAGQLSPTALTPGQNVPSGTVSVMAASNQTPASTVPKGATNLNMVKFVVTNNGSSAATVNQVTVKRTGAGATTDLSNVYLYQGASRLTSGRTINSSTNEAVFSGLNVTIPASSSVTLDVLADVYASASAGNVNQLSVTSVMLGSTQATGSAMGNAMTTAGVSAGTVTITKSGSLTNPKVGEQNVKVAEFQLAAGTSEDITVKRVSLYQGGAITSSNLSNLVLKQAGNTVASVSALDSKDKANFEFNFNLAKGDTRTFEVYANVAAGARTGSSETVKFYLEEKSDLYAMGSTYGFGVAVKNASTDTPAGSYDGTSCTSASGDCSYSYVEGGQLTITYNGPSSKDIAKNGKDVEVFNFTMAAQNNLEVKQMVVTFDKSAGGNVNFGDGTTPYFTDVKIVDTASGAVVWGPQDLTATDAATGVLTFTEDVFLTAGTSKTYKVTMDVANASGLSDGDKIRANITMSGLTSSDVRNQDNNTYLVAADIVPTGDVVGNDMTVKLISLETAWAATPSSKSVVKGSVVDAAGFVFTASTGGDVKVTDVALTGMIATSTSTTLADGVQSTRNVSDDVVSVELYDGTTKLGQTKSPAVTTGLVTFNGVNWTIPAGNSKTLTVRMTLSNSAGSDKLKWKLAASGVTAVDTDGNSVMDTSTGLAPKPDTALNADTSTALGTVITVTGAGTVTVGSAGVSSSDATDARIVVAGQTVTMGKVNFTANSEDLKINKLRVTLESATGTVVSVIDDVTSVSLYNAAGTLIAGPVSITPSDAYEGYADFNSITDLTVPKDETVPVTIKATLNTISGGADSGDEISVTVSTSANFEARGVVGSTYLTSIGTGSYTSQSMVVRKGQPKFAIVPFTSNISNGGTNTLMKFTVTADGAPVALKFLAFDVSTTTGVTVATPAISEVGGSDITISSGVTYGANGAAVLINFTSEETITTSKTYEFKMVVSGADTGDSVTTSFKTADTAAVTGDLATANDSTLSIDDTDDTNLVGDATGQDAAYNLVWSDKSATGHNDTQNGTDDWTNGRYVKTLTGSQGLSK